MTRVTNFGRKRKYLEAGFATDSTTTPSEHPASEVNTLEGGQGDSAHPKKRKRTKKSKRDGGDEQTSGGVEAEGETGVEGKGGGPSAGQKMSKMMKKRGGVKSGQKLYFIIHCGRLIVFSWLGVAISGYQRRTEQRRTKRIADRQADTVCFACRAKGHAAKDCPGVAGEGGEHQKNANTMVGICYRFVFFFQSHLSLDDG